MKLENIFSFHKKKNGHPPHLVRQNTITAYQQKSGYGVLIETGTFRGGMGEAQKKKVNQSESGKVLPEILNIISEPTIGKGDYPTIEELTKFVQTKNNRYKLEVVDDIIRYVASNGAGQRSFTKTIETVD